MSCPVADNSRQTHSWNKIERDNSQASLSSVKTICSLVTEEHAYFVGRLLPINPPAQIPTPIISTVPSKSINPSTTSCMLD